MSMQNLLKKKAQLTEIGSEKLLQKQMPLRLFSAVIYHMK